MVLKEFFEAEAESVLVRQGGGQNDFFINLREISETTHQALLSSLQEKFGNVEELQFSSIGPVIGSELRRKSITAFLLILLGISLFVAFAFRKASYPVSSWKYGVVTLVTLFHDVIIAAGFFAALSWITGAELDINIVVAMLVIMGFSVHDTIVVFDRIRENVLLSEGKGEFEDIVNSSVKQTLTRSINTSLTLVVVLISLYIFGAGTLRDFTLLILVGTIVGTYSSIFLASPFLTLFVKK